MEGMGAGLPRNSCILTFKKRTRHSRVDPLLHASSYYALRHGCVDVGNYEAQVPFFPVRFREGFPETPALEEVEAAPSRIDWERFPYIGYLLGWQVSAGDAIRLNGNFEVWCRKGHLTVWKRKQL